MSMKKEISVSADFFHMSDTATYECDISPRQLSYIDWMKCYTITEEEDTKTLSQMINTIFIEYFQLTIAFFRAMLNSVFSFLSFSKKI